MNSPRNIYIAVVDDDESLCRSLARLLRASGYQPIGYPSAEAFLSDTSHPRFDCLLLDIHLGGISGIELHRRLAAVGLTTPVVFLTAHDDPTTRAEAGKTGSVAFIGKTESADVLLAAIDKAVHLVN